MSELLLLVLRLVDYCTGRKTRAESRTLGAVANLGS